MSDLPARYPVGTTVPVGDGNQFLVAHAGEAHLLLVPAPGAPLPVPRPQQAQRTGAIEPRVLVSITTCERPESLMALLLDLDEAAGDVDLRVRVYDDASKADYSACWQFINDRGWSATPAPNRLAKRGYVETVSLVLRNAFTADAEYRYFLQDDLRLCKDFFARTIALWDGIAEPLKATLFLFRDDQRAGKKAPWTDIAPQPAGNVDRTQWVDGVAFMYSDALRIFPDKGGIPALHPGWWRDPMRGSGLGRQLSKILHRAGAGLYQTRHSYVRHPDHGRNGGSVMNPEARSRDPLRTIDFIDDEDATMPAHRTLRTASLASIPSRKSALKEVVRRLLPQVDRINVFLNGYGRVPGFLKLPKITVQKSESCRFGDQGDAGKFYWAEDVRGYHVVCDDDVAYPLDFVDTLVGWVEKYHRQAVVGCHGAVLSEPFRDYYRDRRTYHYATEVLDPIPVQILASNSLCYHSDTISVSRDQFKHPNMADVWFALEGQRREVPFVCIPHVAGWLSDLDYDKGDSIYAHSKRGHGGKKDTAVKQTEVIKASLPWTTHRVSNSAGIVRIGVRGPTQEATICSEPEQHIGHVIARAGTYYERDLLDAIRAHQRQGIYVDVGAHCGNHATYFALECPSTCVIAVEPHPRTFEELGQTIAANAFDRVYAYQIAIDRKAEKLWLHDPDPDACARPNRGGISARPEPSAIEVEAMPLDGLLCSYEGPVAVIKIDVEGLGPEVISSGLQTIKRDRPLIACEAATLKERQRVDRRLRPQGYKRDPRTYCKTATYLWVPKG